MNKHTFQQFETWFEKYVKSFSSSDPDYQRQIDLKKDHTRRVCLEAEYIGKQLGIDEDALFIVRLTALFHDIGRFAQYARYQTFSDKDSVNHAVLGTQILKENDVLKGLGQPVRDLVLKVVQYHNRAYLPEDETQECLFYSRLLRDADKLDIWRVLTDYYLKGPEKEKNSAIELSLPDTPAVSPGICQRLLQGQCIEFASMKNLNDFKLLQAGWVFDINFLPSLKRLKKKGYLAILQKSLPETEQIRQIFQAIDRYIEKRLAQPPEATRAAGVG